MLVQKTLTLTPEETIDNSVGKSEIHAHVVHMSPKSKSVKLNNTKAYLIKKNKQSDYWYKHSYVNNSQDSAYNDINLNYLKTASLDADNNFSFLGLNDGSYYVIIESDNPNTASEERKVYIAKSISVKKDKKVMTVFSKEL